MIFVYCFLKVMFPSTLPQRSPSTTAPRCVSTTLHVGTFQKCCTWPGSFLEDAESQHKSHLSKWGSGRREVTCPTNTQKGSNRSSEKKTMLFFFLFFWAWADWQAQWNVWVSLGRCESFRQATVHIFSCFKLSSYIRPRCPLHRFIAAIFHWKD